jgi:hypothetical protein
MTIAPESTSRMPWPASDVAESTESGLISYVVVPPQTQEQSELLARLIERARNPVGFDRETLLRLDADAWGVTEE